MSASFMFAYGRIGVFLLALLGADATLPLGLPPLPEDPTISAAAPEECLWYLNWSGVGDADPKSSNQAEQLLAEPEVNGFFKQVGDTIFDQLQKSRLLGEKDSPSAILGTKLLRTIYLRPSAIFVSKAGINARGPTVEGGAIVGTGDQTDELKQGMEKLEADFNLSNARPAGENEWHNVPLAPDFPKAEWGFRGKYLIVGFGEGSAEAIWQRSKSQTVPDWLTETRKKLPIERLSTLHYVNVQGWAKTFEAAKLPLPKLGELILSNVQSVSAVGGFDGSGYVRKNWVRTEKPLGGVWKGFGSTPLTAADLRPIPPDASFALAAKIDAKQLLKGFLETLEAIEPRGAEEVVRGLSEIEQHLGLGIADDLLQPLGDTWCVYNSPGEGGLLLTGLTLVVTLKDHDKLVKTNGLLVAKARAALLAEAIQQGDGRPPRGVQLKENNFRNQTIYYANVIGEKLLVTPAWCITDKHLIVSLSPQNIRAFLSRESSAKSVAEVPQVVEQLKKGEATVLTYSDTAGTLKTVYPLAQLFVAALFSDLQRQGIPLDGASLPSLPALLRHAELSVGTMTIGKDGLLFESKSSLPFLGGGGMLLPMFFFGAVKSPTVRF